LVGVLALAIHGRALDAPFVWDDRFLILRSPLVTEAHPLSAYLRAPFWNERFEADAVRAFFRPIVTLSYRLDYLLSGPSPFGFHLTNIVLHAAVTVLLFAWMCRLGAGVLASALATSLWALEPRLTESVSWVSGRTDVLAMLLMLGAALVWPDAETQAAGRRLREWAAAALVFAALLAKEVAVVGAFAIVATEVLRHPRPRAWAMRLVPLAVALLGYGALRWSVASAMPTGESAPHGSPWFMPLSSLGTYAIMVVDPRPAAQIGDVSRPSIAAAVLGAGVVVAAGFAGWRLVRTRAFRLAGPACLAAFGVALVIHVVPLPVSVIAADRYLYVPLAGIAALAALAATGVPARVRQVALFAGGGVAVLFAVLTTMRIDDWRDELRFWIVTARGSTEQPIVAMGELANVLYRDADYVDALPIYRAVAERSDGAIGRRHLSNAAASLAMLGRYDEALAVRQSLLSTEPQNPRRYFDVGLVHLHARRFDSARAGFERALALAPDYVEARNMMATTREAEAAWPGLATAEGDPVRARWLVRLGARMEAQRAYLALVARPDMTPAEVLEAAKYVVEEGDLKVAEAIVRRASEASETSKPNETPALERLLQERMERAERIQAATPAIRSLLEHLERLEHGGG
jgi:hypothetical protein